MAREALRFEPAAAALLFSDFEQPSSASELRVLKSSTSHQLARAWGGLLEQEQGWYALAAACMRALRTHSRCKHFACASWHDLHDKRASLYQH